MGRSELAAARAGLKPALDQGMDAVRILDVVVANTLQATRPPLTAWK
jgi:hypothetical protein